MRDDLELLNLMVADQDQQVGHYHPGEYWSNNCMRIVEAIRKDGLVDFRANSSIGKGYADTVLIDPFDLNTFSNLKGKIHKCILSFSFVERYLLSPFRNRVRCHFNEARRFRSLYYTEILGEWFAEFSKKYDLPDTLVANPQDTVEINGEKIGMCYLVAFLRLHNFSKRIDFAKAENAMEIGGGFGAWAHTLMHCFPNIKKYVYLDIPLMLYVGTQYLRNFFDNEVVDYAQTRDLEKISFAQGREIITICPWQINKLEGQIDLFFNSASFQEMSEDIVLNYSQNLKPLLHEKSEICLCEYNSDKTEEIIIPQRLNEIVSSGAGVTFSQLPSEFEIYDIDYYIGKMKN